MHHDDPADMSIDDRTEELAALLAAGFLRLRTRPQLAAQPANACSGPSRPSSIGASSAGCGTTCWRIAIGQWCRAQPSSNRRGHRGRDTLDAQEQAFRLRG